MKERRSESRLLCADLVEVCWSDKTTGRSCSVFANVEEISVRGAHLLLEEALPPATDLVLRMQQGELTATVQDCHREPDLGFALAVQLPKNCRWRPRPRHLFDPRGLERREAARIQMR